MMVYGTSSFTRCWFSFNSCVGGSEGGSGGAAAVANGEIVDCTFRFNSANSFGGALGADGQVAVQKCLFDANTAMRGGAIYCSLTAALSIGQNSTFKHCVASDHGAAVYTAGETTVSDTRVKDFDSSTSDAAVFYHESANATSLIVLRRTTFEDVQIKFVASSQPDTIVVINCDGIGASDVHPTSLLTCGYSEMWKYCSPEHCIDGTVGIEVAANPRLCVQNRHS